MIIANNRNRARLAILFAAGLSVAMFASCKKKTIVRHESIKDVPGYISMLERPSREAWQKPAQVIKALEIKEGSTIADIGAGSGYFTFLIAQEVGPEGVVYAVDIEPGLLEYIKTKAEEQNITNILTIKGVPDDALLESHSIDLVFFCNTLHHIDLPYAYLDNLKRYMKPSARLAVIDYKRKKSKVGPRKKIRLKRKKVIYMMEGMGFKLIREYDFLEHQYYLVFVYEQKY